MATTQAIQSIPNNMESRKKSKMQIHLKYRTFAIKRRKPTFMNSRSKVTLKALMYGHGSDTISEFVNSALKRPKSLLMMDLFLQRSIEDMLRSNSHQLISNSLRDQKFRFLISSKQWNCQSQHSHNCLNVKMIHSVETISM